LRVGLPGAATAWLGDAAGHAGAAPNGGASVQIACPDAAGLSRYLWVAPGRGTAPAGLRSTSTPGAGARCKAACGHRGATVEQFVPQMLNYELLGGVDFKKGCYPGQEIVARSQYRGTIKRRTFLFETAAPRPPARRSSTAPTRASPPGGRQQRRQERPHGHCRRDQARGAGEWQPAPGQRRRRHAAATHPALRHPAAGLMQLYVYYRIAADNVEAALIAFRKARVEAPIELLHVPSRTPMGSGPGWRSIRRWAHREPQVAAAMAPWLASERRIERFEMLG
jgi:folate-binding protein YgfZ